MASPYDDDDEGEGMIPWWELKELEDHLQDLGDIPRCCPEEDVFDRVSIRLTDANTPPVAFRFLRFVVSVLIPLEDEPTVVSDFALKLLKSLTFAQALTLTSEDELVGALQTPSPYAHIFAIAVVEKAAQSPGDIAVLSVMRKLMKAFVQTWLSSPRVEVGERGGNALVNLLSIDRDNGSAGELPSDLHGPQTAEGGAPGQALLWRRIFRDPEIYRLLLDLCSFRTIGDDEGKLDERQKSLAQARLLRVLPQLAVSNFSFVADTYFPEIEEEYGAKQGEEGLLWFAATNMVNTEQDMLMHVTLIDFFPDLMKMISEMETTPRGAETYFRNFLKKVSDTDIVVSKTLTSIALDPETPPKLSSLLMLGLEDQSI